MRLASACVILVVLSIAAYATWAQQVRAPASATSPAVTTGPAPTTGQSQTVAQAPTRAVAPAPAATIAAAPPPVVAPLPTCNNPDALGLARVVEIDTTNGPGFGYEHFKMHDFLRDKEVVLTFDDGPWPGHTPAVLKALADQCLKATFFPIGKHATYYPDILKHVAEAGHTVGNHTWGHKDLSRKPYSENLDLAKEEIEKGISAVRMVVGGPTAPFFRFPALRHPPEMVTYLGQRNIAIFSTDFDSFDFTMRRPEQIVKSVMTKLEKRGKGIILMHDFQQHTGEALPEILRQLKAGGYKVVHMKPKESVQTLAQYDEMVAKEAKLPTVSDRPTSSVVRTISE